MVVARTPETANTVAEMETRLKRNTYPLPALLLTSVVFVAGVHAVSLTENVDLGLYFGGVPPILATTIVCIAGLVAFYILYKCSGLSVFEPGAFKRGLPVAAVLAVPFMIAVTISDIVSPFHADINVALPVALMFYPAMGYVAQIALHVVPFALLLVFSNILPGTLKLHWRIWIAIVLASMLEPAFQVMSSVNDDRPSLATAVMATTLFSFGVVELQIYRRFDFATMFVFRMLYYCYWHLIWGYLRLHWLF